MKDNYELTGNDYRTTLSGNLDWVITPTFFVNVTGGYFRTNVHDAGSRGTATRHHSLRERRTLHRACRPATSRRSSGSPSAASGYADNISSSGRAASYDRTYVNANTIWYKSLAGQHVFKVGVRYERVGNDIYQRLRRSRVHVSSGTGRDTTG